VQRTCVGWAARSVRSLRYHGTVLCLADSAPNFTASRFLVAGGGGDRGDRQKKIDPAGM